MRRRAGTFSSLRPAAAGKRCCWPAPPRNCARTTSFPNGCFRCGSWKRTRRSSMRPISGSKRCFTLPANSPPAMPDLRGNCARRTAPWPRGRAGIFCSKSAPAQPSWKRRTAWESSLRSWSRTCKRCAPTRITISAGSCARSFRRSPASCCWPRLPVVSRGWTMRGSRSSSCSASSIWSRWTRKAAGGFGKWPPATTWTGGRSDRWRYLPGAAPVC